MPFITAALVIAFIIIIVSCIKIVSQGTSLVTEFLGKYYRTMEAGIHIKIPLLEKVVKKVNLKEQMLDSPPQPVITRDNVTMRIDAVVFYKVFDANLFTYGAHNPIAALDSITATTLRNIVGELDLDATLTSRDTINSKLTQLLDAATDPWGIKVFRVEIKNIIPPAAIQEAMEKQMKAEREKRETLLLAEAEKDSAIKRAEGMRQAAVLQAEGERDAKIARAEGEAKALILAKEAEAKGMEMLKNVGLTSELLMLKQFEAARAMADGNATKIIVPTDMASMVKSAVSFGEASGLADKSGAE